MAERNTKPASIKLNDFFNEEELAPLTQNERKILEEATTEELPEVPPEEAKETGKACEELIKKKLRNKKAR